jgi:hypothetical protein
MANTIGWGQASVENTIGYGQGTKDNTIGWGEGEKASWSGETNITGAGGTPAFSNVNSFSFDGVDDFFLGTSTYSELNETTKATWSIWLKPNLSGTGMISRVSTSTSSSAFVYQFFVLASGEVLMQIGDTTRRARTGTNYLTANVWSHILVTYNGTLSNGNKTKIFVNGIDSTSTDGTTATRLNPANYSLQIGRRDFGTGTNYGGLMDEFAIWNNTTLTPTQSLEIYNGGVPNDLNTLPTATQPTTWQRFGDNGATWNGVAWTMTDVNGSYINRGVNMSAANKTTDVPPSPPFNVYSTIFDGVDDYVSLASKTQNFTDFSLSFWTKGGGGNYKTIVGSGSSTEGGILFAILQAGGTIRYYDDSSGWTNLSANVRDGNWHHILITYNSTSNTLLGYQNGSLHTTKTGVDVSSRLTNVHSFNQIGRRITTGYYNALLDEISVFSSVLSASDVSTIYGTGVPTSLASLNPVHWWRMGDGDTSPTLTDNGSGGINGTMQNFTTFSTDVPT